MAFMAYDWLYGIAQFSASFLAIIAAVISISLFRSAWKVKVLHAWKYLLIALILFAFEEVAGGLKTFGLISSLPFITHIIPTFILGFIIVALILEILVAKGWYK